MSFTRANAGLGGKLADLEGRPIALKLLSEDTVEIRTSEVFEGARTQPALRARVIDIEAKQDMGTFLVFWAGVQQTLLDNTKAGYDFTVGVLAKEPHPTNPDFELWVLGEATVTDAEITAAGVT